MSLDAPIDPALASAPEAASPAGLMAEEARVAASLDHWKRKLLDISKRNRALNFRPTKASTLAIVDEHPAEVFRTLCQERKAMRFLASAPPLRTPVEPVDPEGAAAQEAAPVLPGGGSATASPAAPPAPAAPAGTEEEGLELPASAEFVPYAEEALDARHKDDVLQTTVGSDLLDRTLRRVEEQARETLEEQGVNTLFLALGMLHYQEAATTTEAVLRAPLVLVPVELSRSSARAAYQIRATDDDPLVNPALAEYLRRTFGLILPELTDPNEAAEGGDLQRFLGAVRDLIAEQKGWTVKTDIVLSFFSFQKLVMYKDLEANAELFRAHPLIRQVILRSGSAVRGLPAELRQVPLDQAMAPEAGCLVTNADGSQLRSILAVSQGHSLVLEGPPGTGKSQTITNLIAQALGQGKSVLFVAEKMAALEVVHHRLQEAGLAEFCLELHSTKANKRAVMRELGATLDLSLQRPAVEEFPAGRLARVRSELTGYARAVHEPHGALGWSPYRAYGELEALRNAPRLRLAGGVTGISADQLVDSQRAVEELAKAAEPLGEVAAHPWRDSRRTFYTEDDLDQAHQWLTELKGHLSQVRSLASRVETEFSFPSIRDLAGVRQAASVAEVFRRSPGAPLAVLQSEGWNSPPHAATELLRLGQEFQEHATFLRERFTEGVFLQRHEEDIRYLEAKEAGVLRVLNFLDGRYRALKQRWMSYRLPSYARTLPEQAADLRRSDAYLELREQLRRRGSEGEQLFGALWQGEASNWAALAEYVRWVVEFRKLCVSHGLQEQALRTASRPQPDLALVEQLRAESVRLEEGLRSLGKLVQWPVGYLEDASFEALSERVEALLAGHRLAPRWATFAEALARVERTPAAELLPAAMSGELPFAEFSSAFRRAVLQKWVSELVEQRDPLRGFHGVTHEQRIGEFRDLDEQVLLQNRTELIRQLRDQVQAGLRSAEAVAALPFLRRQLSLQRNLAPLRITMQRAGAAIRAIKPVFMMSPLSVSQLLTSGFPRFDLVIFDEASQLPAEDAVGSIARGEQLVVVGDPKQLPPTNFFSVMSGTVTAPLGEDGLPLFEDSESILEEFAGSGAPSTRLKWHYRSLHEALIHFSNLSFYDSDLYTFPSVETHSREQGLSFEWVPEGVYEGKGLNQAEARRVVDAVVRHARAHPGRSLGVGTFSLRQQLAIQDLLEERRRADPSLEPFFARGKREPFFVKNLENIQGDERDVIFLSVTYGRDSAGTLRYNFGPLNGENGWRRLNVLTTRARRQMRVFSSIKGEEINPVQATSRGPQLLRDFLLYAEHGRLDSVSASVAAGPESPFEREVYLELTRRGLTLQPQVGVAGYRIDLGVVDEELPGRFLCGIECDGVAYHSSETARDRDRLRQQVLEARGWTLIRLWSTDWFKDREGQIERLLRLVEAAREASRRAEEHARQEEALAEREAEASAAEAAAAQAETPPVPGLPAARVPVVGVPYQSAQFSPLHLGGDLGLAPAELVWQAIAEVMAVEAPLHLTDLAARVAVRWGADRVGPRMMRNVRSVVERAAQHDLLLLRGDFVYAMTDPPVVPRTRAGTGIPADRIPPEEYRAAVLLALQGPPLQRRDLINEVRSVFGFSRTGATLDAAIGTAVDGLLAEQVVGEGGSGLVLRR